MGLLGRFGERSAINAKHARPQEEPNSQSEQKRYEFLTFDEIRTLEPVAPCGFDFCNVSYHVRRRIDKATGEVEESEWCDLEEPNYTRNMQAILHSWYVFSQADRATDGWPSNEYGRIMKEACVLGPSYKDKSRFHYTFGVIKPIPPEPYGDPPRCPVECYVECSVPTGEDAPCTYDNKDTMQFTTRYTQDGSLENGQYVLWRKRDGYMLEFDSNKNGYSIYALKYRQVDGDEGWETISERTEYGVMS